MTAVVQLALASLFVACEYASYPLSVVLFCLGFLAFVGGHAEPTHNEHLEGARARVAGLWWMAPLVFTFFTTVPPLLPMLGAIAASMIVDRILRRWIPAEYVPEEVSRPEYVSQPVETARPIGFDRPVTVGAARVGGRGLPRPAGGDGADARSAMRYKHPFPDAVRLAGSGWPVEEYTAFLVDNEPGGELVDDLPVLGAGSAETERLEHLGTFEGGAPPG